MLLLWILLIWLQSVSCARRHSKPCEEGEFSCENGQCIPRRSWCDSRLDCRDKSDERYCRAKLCSPSYFLCDMGWCIPRSGRCDGKFDCPDRTDERSCLRNSREHGPLETGSQVHVNYSVKVKKAIESAANYLLSNRDSWVDPTATARALIALKFADAVVPLNSTLKKLMEKELNIQLTLDLIGDSFRMDPYRLALYINALYATCREPQNFQGTDLVSLLRSNSDSMHPNSSSPVVFLALCLAGNLYRGDATRVLNMHNSSPKMSTKVLSAMVMLCFKRKNYTGFDKTLSEFKSEVQSIAHLEMDIYTKAMIKQVSNAFKSSVSITLPQLKDGSFGDLLATYYAIPALLGKSLLDLKCMQREGIHGETESRYSDGINVKYSLWIAPDTNGNSHSIIVSVPRKNTLYDVMNIAQTKDPLYRFLYDETSLGKTIYSLADIPNDIESGMRWTLYYTNSSQISMTSKRNLEEMIRGVDKINMMERKNPHFIFSFQRI